MVTGRHDFFILQAYAPEHREPVYPWQHDVENDKIRLARLPGFQSGVSVFGQYNLIALQREVQFKAFRDVAFVFYYQNAFFRAVIHAGFQSQQVNASMAGPG